MKGRIIAFGVIAVLLTGCVSQDDYDRVLQENRELEDEIDGLESEIRSLEKENASLKETIETLQDDAKENENIKENNTSESNVMQSDKNETELIDMFEYDFVNGDSITVNLIKSEYGSFGVYSFGTFSDEDVCIAVEALTCFIGYSPSVELIFNGTVGDKTYRYIYIENRMSEDSGEYGDPSNVDDDMKTDLIKYNGELIKFLENYDIL